MADVETIKTTRDVKAIVVPFGQETVVPKDTEVIILQALGGTYTVVAGGQTVRIADIDADALGKMPMEDTTYINDPQVSIEDKIWAQLKTCYDPEIPVNIVDLGLIYEIKLENLAVDENGNDQYKAVVRMTLTAPGCGMGPIIAAEAKSKVALIPQIKDVEMVIVFDPPWDRSRLSDAAKLALGLL
jgi:probable FeS assembly SUF system protein SufT